MVRIIKYIDRKFDKRSGFSRAEVDEEEFKDKTTKKTSKRVWAEDELEQLMSEGWEVINANTSQFVTGFMGTTTSFEQLTVILRKTNA